VYHHVFDASSEADQSIPDVIKPLDAGENPGRWHLVEIYGLHTHWQVVSTDNYTATPASTSTITMSVDMTGDILPGMSIRYTIDGTVRYGQVAAITSNLLTVRGAPLSDDITNIEYGGGCVTQLVMPVGGKYEDANNTALLTSDAKMPLTWLKERAYAVHYRVWSRTNDSGATKGKASVRIANTELNTSAGGLTITSGATWYATGIDIAVGAYEISFGDSIEVTCVKGTTGDAEDLNVILTVVTP
jgi:hypothetical protein